MRKLLVAAMAVMAAGAVFSGNVCHWTGGGADGSWQTAANWDVAPVSGNGDVLSFENGVGGSNGVAGFSVGGVRCLGSSPVAIGGEEVRFTGGYAVSNTVALTMNAPVTIAANTKLTHYNDATYNADVKVEGTVTVVIGPNDKACHTVTFNGSFDAPDAVVQISQGNAASINSVMPVVCNRPFRVKTLINSVNYKTSALLLNATGNSWTNSSCAFGSIRAGRENAYPHDAVLKWGDKFGMTISGHPYWQSDLMPDNAKAKGDYRDLYDAYDLNGFNQAIDRIDCKVVPTAGKECKSVVSDLPATLTMNATADGYCNARMMGALSLVWNPAENRTLTFTNRVHQMSGKLTVAKGTVRTAGTCSFPRLSALSVGEGAVLDVATESPSSMASVLQVTLAANAELRLGAAGDPFGAAKPAIVARSSSHIVIPAGVTVTASILQLDGSYLSNAEITSGLVTGGGTLVVEALPSGIAYWKQAADGAWGTAGNWLAGTVPAAADDIRLTATPGDYAVRVEAAVAPSGPILLENGGGGATTLAISNTFAYGGTDLKLSPGTAITVGEGGLFTMAPPAPVANDDEVFVLHGAKLTVDGGTVDFTGGDTADQSDANFHGQFTVEGGDGHLGEIEVKSGLFTMIPWWGGKDGNAGARLRLRDGGRISVSGGIFRIVTGWWWNEPLVMSGGEIDVSNDGVMIVNCRTDANIGTAGYFGTGTVTFRDNARLEQPNNSYGEIYMPATRDSVPRNLEMTFRDHARLSFTSMVDLGGNLNTAISNPNHTSTTHLTLDSDASHVVGGRLGVGVNSGSSVVDLKQGALSITNGSLSIAHYSNHSKNSTMPMNVVGVVNVCGGRLNVNGKSYLASTSPGGLLIGNTLPLPTGGSYCLGEISTYSGTLNLTSGAVTNQAGIVLIGSGLGTGLFRQSGGSFAHNYALFSVIGFLGGDGTYEITGGTSDISGDLYVGGALKGTLGCGLVTTGRVAGVAVDLASTTVGQAKGLLRVSGGSLTLKGASRRLVLSDDGEGRLEIGPAGLVAVNDVDFRNGASTVKFVFGADGSCGQLTAEGAVTVSAGTKLVLDFTACNGRLPKSRRLIACNGLAGAFAAEDITVLGAGGVECRVNQSSTGVKVSTGGLRLIFR